MPSKPLTEAEYWQNYVVIRDDVDAVIRCFYVYFTIHKFAQEDSDIYESINRGALFWKTLLYGLQTSYFIVSGRIFDDASDACSIHKLLSSTVAHPEFFSRTAFVARRKRNSRGKNTDYLDKFAVQIWEPTVAELRAIRKTFNSCIKKFKIVYQIIRSKIYAHKILTANTDVSELLSKGNMNEIEDIIYHLWNITETLQDLWHNGCRPNETRMQDYKAHIQKCIVDLTRTVLLSLVRSENRS
jgi:hypothetical protein